MANFEKLASITLDTSELQSQISELRCLLELPSGTLQGVSEHGINLLLGKIFAMANDIVLSDGPAATVTGCTFNIVQRVRFGSEFERLTAAIRAGELNVESF